MSDLISRREFVAASAVAAVKTADVIITMLPAGRHVVDVYEQIVSAAPKGAVFVDCSTIDVASARKAHDLATAKRF